MTGHLVVPAAVQRKAQAVGAAGRHWLDDLPATVDRLARSWALEVGEVLDGGSGALVVTTVTAGGIDAVLKVSIPDGLEGHGPFRREQHVMQLGQGHGYARVLRTDETQRAVLVERLGPSLEELHLPVEDQIDITARTLRHGWIPLPADQGLRTGAEQAQWLHDFVRTQWELQGRPCAEAVIELAERHAAARRDAHDPATSVLVHGDAHAANVLEDLTEADRFGGFKLVDPDGLRSEPAHDLAIPLRGWTDELLAGDAVALGTAWCARLADRGGVDPSAVWQWAFVERVSTGLFLRRLGDPAGDGFLAVAEQWLDA